MNEEIMVINEEIEDTEVEVINEEPETSGNGITGIILGGLALVAGVTAVVLHKNKDKREAKKIQKLRDKGYVIITPEEAEEIMAEDDAREDEAEEK